jgi:hypothetical protein
VKPIFIITSFLILTVSCDRAGKVKKMYTEENGEFLKRQTLPDGEELLLQYMPMGLIKQQNNNTREILQFRADFTSRKESAFFAAQGNGFYNTDSFFCMIHKGDTLWPLYVLPVANGIKTKREYVVAFPQLEAGDATNEILVMAVGLSRYYDGLQPFSFKLAKINKLEKLN